MKNFSFKLTFVLFLSVVGLYIIPCTSCNYSPPEPTWKSDTILPPITTIGANTSGCFVNGKFWLVTPTRKTNGSYSRGSVSIVLERSGNNELSNITISSVYNMIYVPGIYKYSRKLGAGYLTVGKLYRTNNDTDNVGYLNIIRLDSVNRILSGTFEFKGYSSSLNPNSISITSGRFDINY
jgi:hypothetical protein